MSDIDSIIGRLDELEASIGRIEEAIDLEEEEAIDEYFRSDAKRMFYLALDDLRSGDYSQAEATICDFLEHWNL